MLAISDEYKLDPEVLEFTDTYLASLDLQTACRTLQIPEEQGAAFLRKKEVKRFIDTVFEEQGYTNRFKIKDVLERAVESKLEEAEETGIYTKYDLLDVLKMLNEMRKDSIKESSNVPGKQTNVQVNSYGQNLGDLLSKIQK
jgi:hypothetical protein